VPVADYMCAMMLALGVAAALLRRTRTGRGGEVEVSLLMAALVVQNNAMVRVEAADGPVHQAVRARLTELRGAGQSFAEQVALTPQVRTPAMVNVYYRTYATRDAAIAVACVSPGLQRAFMTVLGLVDDVRPETGREEQERHYTALRRRAETVMTSRTTAEWKTVLDARGIPAAAVHLPLELLDDEQVLANGLLHDLDHPRLGRVRVLAPPVRLDGPGFRPAPLTAPYGSETRVILRGLGFSDDEVADFVAAGVTREGTARDP
jgi:crotonobetainyl-CoA:carnitine CoA-transferase CaiB-like acyl-CoA transferase